MIPVMLAVMKAGATYVPLDPDFHEKRVRLILENCDARLVFTERRIQEKNASLPVPVVLYESANCYRSKYTARNGGSNAFRNGIYYTYVWIYRNAQRRHDNT